MTGLELAFDPRLVLAALQRAGVSFVVIGGLARVIRGSDELTWGVDICPSVLDANRGRVEAALDELQAEGSLPAATDQKWGSSRDRPLRSFRRRRADAEIVCTDFCCVNNEARVASRWNLAFVQDATAG